MASADSAHDLSTYAPFAGVQCTSRSTYSKVKSTLSSVTSMALWRMRTHNGIVAFVRVSSKGNAMAISRHKRLKHGLIFLQNNTKMVAKISIIANIKGI